MPELWSKMPWSYAENFKMKSWRSRRGEGLVAGEFSGKIHVIPMGELGN